MKGNFQGNIVLKVIEILVKVESQEIPGITGKFGLGVQNETGKG